ncbi:uncharacterized protein LOC144090331 isoform X2 [Stigmatopora argus]
MTLPAEETLGEEPQEAKAVSDVSSLQRTQEFPGQPQQESVATDQSSTEDFQDRPDENSGQNDPERMVNSSSISKGQQRCLLC